MNVALRKPMTLEQFLRWEARQDTKHEFDGFAPVAMTGVRVAHSVIQRNLLVALGNRLRGQPCQPHGSDLKIQVVGRIRYPDAFVVCTRVDLRATVVHDPVVVFEVLSEGTAVTDLVVKNAEYRQTPSVRRYVVLRQDAVAATVFSHDADWQPVTLGAGASLDMPEIGIAVPLAEIYDGLALDPDS